MIRVELKKHVGHMGTPLGTVEVDNGQWEVLVSADGSDPIRRVGYLGYHENAHIQPVVNLPNEVWVEVIRQCEEQKGAKVNGVTDFSNVMTAQSFLKEQQEDGENEE